MQKIILSIIIVILIVLAFRDEKTEVVTITKVNNFEECLLAGYPVQESYPRRCVSPDGKAFSEYIGNRIEKQDLIVVDSPLPNQTINSAFQISGKARGFWFFEGEISGRVLDQSKKTISNFSTPNFGCWENRADELPNNQNEVHNKENTDKEKAPQKFGGRLTSGIKCVSLLF